MFLKRIFPTISSHFRGFSTSSTRVKPPPSPGNNQKYFALAAGGLGLGAGGAYYFMYANTARVPEPVEPSSTSKLYKKYFTKQNTTVIFVLGGPGAGKGTQCSKLVNDFGFVHLSAGDLLRAERERPGSEYGELINNYIREGEIVPMEITIALLENAMRSSGQRKFLIDGFPRKMDQALKFEEAVCESSMVLYFECPDEEMLKRLLRRGQTSGRVDDNEESIKKRFKTFHETSFPVIEHYEKLGKVRQQKQSVSLQLHSLSISIFPILLIQGLTEPVLRLILSLFSCYAIAYLYRVLFVLKRTKTFEISQTWPQHLFSTVFGLLIGYFNYGNDVLHFVVAISISWLILKIAGPTPVASSAVFAWSFFYLLAGYYYNSTENYDLDWTTSYCVMCLRLIGFAMDYSDGNKGTNQKKQTRSNILNAHAVTANWENASLSRLPSMLETFGYCLFFSGFLVGPQFPFALYENFVTLKSFETKDGKILLPSSRKYGFSCFLSGIYYMAITHLGNMYFPTSFIFSDTYSTWSFLQRLGFCIVAGRIVLYKYLGVWLINETTCVLAGISFQGYDEKSGKPRWNGLSNVDPYPFETVTSLNQVIMSFNMNTNLWCKNYIFKRLKFLGSKELSGIGTLLFLAIWHGFSPAYFMTFISEFIDMEAERRLKLWTYPIWNRISLMKGPIKVIVSSFGFIICYLLTNVNLVYGSISFDLLQWNKVWYFWRSLYFFSPIGVAIVLAIDFLLPKRESKSSNKGNVLLQESLKKEN